MKNIKNNLLTGTFIFLLAFSILIYLNRPVKPFCFADHKHVFTEIFETDAWNGGYGNRPESNAQYLKFLQYFINTTPINSIVDIGCADWNLMKHINIPKNINYLGIDVVDKIIENNNKEYKSKNIKFEANNSVEDLTKYKGDLLIIKDVLHMWSNYDILFAIEKIIPNFKYAIIVNNIWLNGAPPMNSEIITGNSRPIDLEVAPFSMKLRVLFDYYVPPFRKKRVYLYIRDEQPSFSDDFWKNIVDSLKQPRIHAIRQETRLPK